MDESSMSPPGDEDRAAPPAEKQCPWCSETIRADALKCRHCGEFLGQARPATPAASIYRLLVGLVVVAVLIAGTVFYVREQDRREAREARLLTEMEGLSDEQLCEIAGHPADLCPPG